MFELIKLFPAMLTGVIITFLRLIIVIIASPVMMLRVEKTMNPEWLSWLLPDKRYLTYKSVVGIYHVYNNPIALTFSELLKLSLKRPQPKLISKKILINRLYLCLFLSRHPYLKKYRNRELPSNPEQGQ
eukprot:TRINITY_DN23360_c0_g1_i1.p1 TRINITY_DN23360_c0_g1~~TRINITY_DN23360_c0_g1_i1.p1  ORF type:complete len:129 (+),score=13.81 TRINITY_DN23360_c0_g1_i1:114-500(+)